MSQHKSISKRQGLPNHIVDNDGVLDRLKFISKGEEHQKERGKETYGTKATVIPNKATAASKKKRAKKKEPSDEESEEQEERLIRRKPKDKPTRKSVVSDEGAGTSLEVPNETKDKSEAQDDLDDWGSTDDETFLFDDKDKKVEDIPWVSTDEDESDDDEEGDESTDIEMTDDKKTNTNVEDQFLNSPNVSLIGTIQENTEAEINYLLDIQIQQDVPNIQQEPFHAVKVSVIPDPTQIPPSTTNTSTTSYSNSTCSSSQF
ncbi:hypothetical protein Tco_1043535 [Tanacetum coccineum]|uniref:Uncharacterized protein n=1 Tax=Tanacetum coccineum TaxID=301880 RepID=A0ABQ5GMY3_9ASTR